MLVEFMATAARNAALNLFPIQNLFEQEGD